MATKAADKHAKEFYSHYLMLTSLFICCQAEDVFLINKWTFEKLFLN